MKELTFIINGKWFYGQQRPTTQEDNFGGIVDHWILFGNISDDEWIGRMVQWDDARYVVTCGGVREILEPEAVEIFHTVTAQNLECGVYENPKGEKITIHHIWEGTLFLTANYSVNDGRTNSLAVGLIIQNLGPLVKVE